MKLFSFIILMTLAVIYVALTVGETVTYRKWQRAVYEQKDVQAKLSYFQNLNRVIEVLVRRMAYDSQHDPAIAQMLKDRRIKVVLTGPPQPSSDATGTIPVTQPTTNPNLPSSLNSSQAPSGTNSSHP